MRLDKSRAGLTVLRFEDLSRRAGIVQEANLQLTKQTKPGTDALYVGLEGQPALIDRRIAKELRDAIDQWLKSGKLPRRKSSDAARPGE